MSRYFYSEVKYSKEKEEGEEHKSHPQSHLYMLSQGLLDIWVNFERNVVTVVWLSGMVFH